jgi:hypothetical protein
LNSRSTSTVKGYFWGVEMQRKFSKTIFIENIKYAFLLKTKSFVVNLLGDCVRRLGRKIKIIKIIYRFHYEGNVLAETLNFAHGISGLRGTQFEHR